MSFPDSLPSCPIVSSFWTNPLGYLRSAKECHGNLVALTSHVPIFSRAAECSGTVAVFGEDFIRLVLTDMETFEMAISVSDRYDLPPPLKNLNSGLFSMRGEKHQQHRRVMAAILNSPVTIADHSLIAASCATFFEDWCAGTDVDLTNEMRRFALHIAEGLLLGHADHAPHSAGKEIQRFFEMRRQYAASQGLSVELRVELISQGQRVDSILREQVRHFAADNTPRNDCHIKQLMRAAGQQGIALAEDEIVAHTNVLFMASSEPVATALTWALLLLAQQPKLRRQLRNEFRDLGFGEGVPTPEEIDQALLLNGVVHEVLRLLPPSAILVRLSATPSRIGVYQLPEKCEFVLSPWVEHRDPHTFPQPDDFLPTRWLHTRPRPFQYMPFGGGARSCLGKRVALYTIKLGIQQTLARFDALLPYDQEIDWLMNLTLLPDPSPVLTLAPVDFHVRGGTLRGPAADLVRLEAS